MFSHYPPLAMVVLEACSNEEIKVPEDKHKRLYCANKYYSMLFVHVRTRSFFRSISRYNLRKLRLSNRFQTEYIRVISIF